MNARGLLLSAILGCGRATSEASADAALVEVETSLPPDVDPIDSTIDPDDLIPAITDLPGNPSGVGPPKGRWTALRGPLVPKDIPAGRVESGGTSVTGFGFLFRSVGGKAGEPFADPADVLRLGPRDLDGLSFDPPSVSAAGGFILGTKRGLFRASPSATAWTRVACPASSLGPLEACGDAVQTITGAILLRRLVGAKTEVFRTADDGATWAPIPIGDRAGCSFRGVLESRVLMQCQSVIEASGDALVSRVPLLLSSDDGKTFVELVSSPGVIAGPVALTDRGVVAIDGSSIRLSKDNGKSWMTTWTSTTDNVFSDWPFPARGKRVFVGGRSKPVGEFFLLRSRDGGETFTKLTAPPPVSGYMFRLAVGDEQRVDAWESHSDDDGETWKPAFSIPAPTLRAAVQQKGAAGANGDLWVSSTGLFRSTDGGATWSSRFGELVSGFAIDEATGAVLVGSSVAIHRSTDGGASWTKVLASVASPFVRAGGGVVIASPASSYSTFALSPDGGLTWQTKTTPTIGLSTMAVSSKGVLFALGNGALAVSSDRGETWKTRKISTSIRGAMEIAPSGEIFIWSRDAIYRSSDDGISWGKQHSAGLPSERRELLAYAPRAPLGMFFARGFVGHPDGISSSLIYASIDGGASFHPYHEGLHAQWVGEAAFDRAGRLFAATYAGVYRFDE